MLSGEFVLGALLTLRRTNSQQSLKIRGLEVETSRLLSENITYREENINLKKELHNAQLTIDHVGTLKILLDKKLGELSSLFTELGKPVVIPPELKTSTRRKSRPTLRRASEPRSWVTAEILAEAEGRLPPISEDNIYPAKALEYITSPDFYDKS